MVKKLLALVICLLLLGTAGAALADAPMVVDDAHLFDAEGIQRLETIIQRIRDTYQMDAVVLTTRDTPSTYDDDVLVDYADRYYEDNGYGLGEDRAGVLYMIDMNNRYIYISTAGVMIDYLNDSRIEDMVEASTEYLSRGDYIGGATRAMTMLERYLRRGIEEGSFRYDEKTGQRLTGLYNRLTTTEALVALVAGAIVAALIAFGVINRYSLAGGTYHYDRASLSSCKLTKDDEQYLRQTVSRVRTPPPSSGGGGHGGGHSGGSGVHVSSGGMSHGGGGGHF